MENKVYDQRFCRVLCVAHLISKGGYNNPLIAEATGLDRRQVQEVIKYMAVFTIECVFGGSNKIGAYVLISWNGINRKWVKDNIEELWASAGFESTPVGGANV